MVADGSSSLSISKSVLSSVVVAGTLGEGLGCGGGMGVTGAFAVEAVVVVVVGVESVVVVVGWVGAGVVLLAGESLFGFLVVLEGMDGVSWRVVGLLSIKVVEWELWELVEVMWLQTELSSWYKLLRVSMLLVMLLVRTTALKEVLGDSLTL